MEKVKTVSLYFDNGVENKPRSRFSKKTKTRNNQLPGSKWSLESSERNAELYFLFIILSFISAFSRCSPTSSS